MKLWHFDIGLGNGQVRTIEAENFEIAYSKLCRECKISFGSKWSLVGFEMKKPGSSPKKEEMQKKSIELWKQVSFDELKQAEQILKKNFEAMKAAVEFDNQHPEVCNENPMAHSNDVYQLRHAEKCIDEFRMWFEY